MANFSIQANIQVLPLEEITFTDTTQKAKGIHSTIDRSFSSSMTKAVSTNSDRVKGITYTAPSATGVTLDSILELGKPVAIKFLYMKLTSRGTEAIEGTGPRIVISVGGQSLTLTFLAIGDFICLGANSITDTESILVYGGTSYASNAYEIVVGLEENA